jgi:hypothetical protein
MLFFFPEKEPKSVALRGLKGSNAILFFSRKEPKALALRGSKELISMLQPCILVDGYSIRRSFLE